MIYINIGFTNLKLLMPSLVLKRGERERGSKTTLIRMHFDAIHKATKGLMVYLWMQ